MITPLFRRTIAAVVGSTGLSLPVGEALLEARASSAALGADPLAVRPAPRCGTRREEAAGEPASVALGCNPRVRTLQLAAMALVLGLAPQTEAQTQSEIAEIAREAFHCGYPMVDNYAVLHSYALDPASPEFKAPVNRISHARRVAGPEDRTIVAPNVDTPYSHAWLDLRAEPIILTIPPFEPGRYVSLQLIDA